MSCWTRVTGTEQGRFFAMLWRKLVSVMELSEPVKREHRPGKKKIDKRAKKKRNGYLPFSVRYGRPRPHVPERRRVPEGGGKGR